MSASMNKQSTSSGRTELKADENIIRDAGYSSSSSSNSGQPHSSLVSFNCTNCGVLCNELKKTVAGNFCFSCFHHWR